MSAIVENNIAPGYTPHTTISADRRFPSHAVVEVLKSSGVPIQIGELSGMDPKIPAATVYVATSEAGKAFDTAVKTPEVTALTNIHSAPNKDTVAKGTEATSWDKPIRTRIIAAYDHRVAGDLGTPDAGKVIPAQQALLKEEHSLLNPRHLPFTKGKHYSALTPSEYPVLLKPVISAIVAGKK